MGNSGQEAQIPLYIVLLVAACASITLNLGKAVQKMKVEVLRNGKKIFKPPYLRDFLIWCFGMFLTLVAGLLIMVAQKMSDKSSLVSSMNGVGLIALAIFALFVLKERVGPREWGAVMLIASGTAIVSLYNEYKGDKFFSPDALLICCLVTAAIFAVLIPVCFKLKFGKAFILAALAGSLLAMMNIFYHIGPIVAPGTFTEQFKTIYPYIGFIIMGNGAFLFTNLAFFHGTGITVVPTVNSFLMICPMIYEIFIFHITLTPMQYAGAAVIIAGVIILTTAKSQVSPATAAA